MSRKRYKFDPSDVAPTLQQTAVPSRMKKYLSAFSLNAGKYRPEKLRIGTLLTQWILLKKSIFRQSGKRSIRPSLKTAGGIEIPFSGGMEMEH